MSKYVDISEKVTATFYDEEHEEWTKQTVTIEDVLDSVCDDYTILPSAERVGKWVERHPMRYDGKFVGADTDIIPDTRIRHLYCGECDKQMPIFEKFPYCPFCGSRNEVSEDD